MAESIIKGIEDSGWINITSNLAYRRHNNIVYISVDSLSNTSLTTAGVLLGTLPAGYRPSFNTDISIGAKAGTSVCMIRVQSDGKVYGWANPNSMYWAGIGSFPIP